MAFIFNSLGAGEILVILAAVLLFFGAERLPEMARIIGKAINKMRRAAEDVSSLIADNDLTGPTDTNASETSLVGGNNKQREG